VTRGVCSEQQLIEELDGVSAAVATGEPYTERVIAALPKLRVIARAGVGYDRVDVTAATRHNVAVTITPRSISDVVAEMTLALLLAAAKRILRGHREVAAGRWPRVPLTSVRGKTLGLVGLGRIGRAVAVRCLPLGLKVIATEKLPDRQFVAQRGIELVDFDTLLDRSDFVSIHTPLTPETRGLFNKTVLAKMKPGGILINTARGPIVCERDLLEALRSGHLRAAALDVFEQEPPAADNPLFALDNVVLSPHLGGMDEQSVRDMAAEVAENIIQLYRGQWPAGAVVNDELRTTWKW
jgi:phosphoglycerate dehydrogenase-like enzyme